MQEARPRLLTDGVDAEAIGAAVHKLAAAIFPLPRSLTGDGVRETLRLVGEQVPLELTEVPTGTTLFDWTAPPEWNVRDAWISDSEGRRVVDYRASNLHVVGYSAPVRQTMLGADLRDHLYSLPDRPDVIPYRTAYWDEAWGFCVTERQREAIAPYEPYEVVIDASLEPGSLTLGEAVLPGDSKEEILLSTYVCHPSLANDNVSGIALLAVLGRHLAGRQLRRTHRLLFGPGTLGPLAWLSRNQGGLDRIRGGLAIACVGDAGPLRYKRSRRGASEVDRAAVHVLGQSRPGSIVEDFVPWGGDERQFCSPGFDLPLGTLTRTPHGAYPEYHSSADGLDLIGPRSLGDSFVAALEILEVLERNRCSRSLNPNGEPQLGRRGLYREIRGGPATDHEAEQRALLWVLNQSDGTTSLLDIAERARLPFPVVAAAAEALLAAELLE
jgi:aminopeptidase-like protein